MGSVAGMIGTKIQADISYSKRRAVFVLPLCNSLHWLIGIRTDRQPFSGLLFIDENVLEEFPFGLMAADFHDLNGWDSGFKHISTPGTTCMVRKSLSDESFQDNMISALVI